MIWRLCVHVVLSLTMVQDVSSKNGGREGFLGQDRLNYHSRVVPLDCGLHECQTAQNSLTQRGYRASKQAYPCFFGGWYSYSDTRYMVITKGVAKEGCLFGHDDSCAWLFCREEGFSFVLTWILFSRSDFMFI
ncbi:hypothetical protein QBC47DRAFT_76490 [Echria macrotheca]|uniref:Secreted protein n=1 Tax=Echria macrotheca TaxID=438768 RepID=A0AAJ0B5Z1_9PEZI|nr:hypothetical protein QBC47DRAFT_76490 [Echria macrotheca]